MTKLLTPLASLWALSLFLPLSTIAQGADKVPAVLNFDMTSLDGKPVKLSKYNGKVLLLVNVASQCGATPQYEQLEQLHEKFASKGLAVLGFPSNEFGAQEPGTNDEIAEFCKKNYGVKFDMFSKVVVNGNGVCPLFKYLISKDTNPQFGGPIKWNFEKFVVGRDGKIVARFETDVSPDAPEVIQAVEEALAKKP